MRAKLVRIGNSRGIRLPKGVIDEVGLGDEVELTVKKGEIIITRVRQVREGWAEDAKLMAERERGQPLLRPPFTRFMLHEQEWPMEDFGITDE
jgi:antitoxin MazE